MTTNSSLKKRIRAYAAEHGISYTAALRAYPFEHDAERERAEQARTAAQAGFLNELLNSTPATPADPISGNTWTIRFKTRRDGVMPYALYITDGGMVTQQTFYRGEKFQIIGFDDADAEPGDGAPVPWRGTATAIRFGGEQAAEALNQVRGKVLVISDITGKWSSWSGDVVEDISFGVRPDHAVANGTALEAIFSAVDPIHVGPAEQQTPHVRFRAEEILAALSDDDLKSLADNEWIADAEISGMLFRAAVARGDEALTKAWKWVDEQYEADPDAWDGDEPYRIDFDVEQATDWLAKAGIRTDTWRGYRD